MTTLIYLASPYSSADPEVIDSRVDAVQRATAHLIGLGHLIFSPILHSHPISHLVPFEPVNLTDTLSEWMRYDFGILGKCDELWVLELDGWDRSKGVAMEIAYAGNKPMPIRRVSYPECDIYE